MAKTSAISVRVSDETKQAVEKAAEEDGRSVASYVERLLTTHLKKEGYLPK
ncbi:Arc family DNA-binding protein [Paracoccus sediminis]|uniref:Arc family DNA-binding protein n=1 Tax=Paracoccus sediminis TaxID=1214787 RepID=A0ABY1YF25_9RHOB|nr:Arc family DNA-binding protein [Paracoccus sediminis]